MTFLQIIFRSLIVSIISFTVLLLIVWLRIGSIPSLKFSAKQIIGKWARVLVLNVIVISVFSAKTPLLALIIADIDLWIMKIPFELLLLLSFKSVLSAEYSAGRIVLAGIIFCCYALCDRVIPDLLGRFDLYYLGLLMLGFSPMESARGISLFFIFWGVAGIINKKARNERRFVPLAPLILLGFAAGSFLTGMTK